MVSFRAAIDDDAPRLSSFAAETFIDTFGADNRPEDMAQYVAQHFQPGIQAREIADPRLATLLAECAGDLVGYAQLREDPDPPAGVHRTGSIELWRFYIARSFHGRGVAKHFLQHLTAVARARHAEAIWLGVWEHNLRARRFYEKCGFERVGHHDFVLGADVQTDFVLQASISSLETAVGRSVHAISRGAGDSIKAVSDSPAIRALLEDAGLPIGDLQPGHGVEFFTMSSPSEILSQTGAARLDGPEGVVGLERLGNIGLLRSLAVDHSARGRGLGTALVAALEEHARASGLTDLYLLTTSADHFFEALGYVRVARDEAPSAVRQTSQFSALCPSTAVLMAKRL